VAHTIIVERMSRFIVLLNLRRARERTHVQGAWKKAIDLMR